MNDGIRSRMSFFSINKRWLLSNLLSVALLLLILEVVFIYSVTNYYYSSPQNDITRKAQSVSALFSAYEFQTVESKEQSFAGELKYEVYDIAFFSEGGTLLSYNRKMAQSFYVSEKDNLFEMIETGRETVVRKLPEFDDQILFEVEEMGNTEQGEKIYAMFAISVQKQQKTLTITISIAVIAGVLIMMFMVFNNLFFIRSIVIPVRTITKTANEISSGNYAVRLQKRHRDEIGALCDAINDMAYSLGENDKMKNEFLSSVSHELKTPLTAIRGWAETLLSGGEIAEDVKKGLEIILKETKRLSKMVENVLTFSTILKSDEEERKEKIDLLEELGEVSFLFKEALYEKRIRLQLLCEEDEAYVVANQFQIRQVFLNVLDNAVKNSRDDSKIVIQVTNRGENAEISFWDEGCGIASGDILHVKERFFKADPLTEGNGIGLAICDEIVEKHGGKLFVESEENEYTKISIVLPKEPRKVQRGREEA